MKNEHNISLVFILNHKASSNTNMVNKENKNLL